MHPDKYALVLFELHSLILYLYRNLYLCRYGKNKLKEHIFRIFNYPEKDMASAFRFK